MKEVLNNLAEKINKRLTKDEKFKKKLSQVHKTFCIDFDGKDFYNFSLENGAVSEIAEGKKDADILIEVSSDLFNKLLNGEEDAMSAYFE
ncbi:sterol binding protein, partial [mine drainage metagenome]